MVFCHLEVSGVFWADISKMAGHLLLRTAQKLPKNSAACFAHHAAAVPGVDPKLANREVVGFGFNGGANYHDRVDFPMPAIRFKPVTPDIKVLREKEKGDWHKLSIEEKKQLYRASFCQTFAELNAPTGRWKSYVGCAIGFMSLSLWIYMGLRLFVYDSELPESFKEENQQAQLKRILDLRMNPIEGISSKWDYEKNEWKK